MVERQLMQMPPQQQQFVISNLQQQIMFSLSHLPPQAIPQGIQLLAQAMSPQLRQIVLMPVISQLNNGGGGIGTFPPNNPSINSRPLQSTPPLSSESSSSSSSSSDSGNINKRGFNQFSSDLYDKSLEIQRDIDAWNKRKDADFAKSSNTFNNYP